jgi:ATP-dependent HslUV protease ATP-binding subunit HslU
MEHLLEEVSFSAPDNDGQKIVIDQAFVNERLGDLSQDQDLSQYIL